MKKMMWLVFLMVPGVAGADSDSAEDPTSGGDYGILETRRDETNVNKAACDTAVVESLKIDLHYNSTLTLTDDSVLKAWIETGDDIDCGGNIPDSTSDDYIGDITLPFDDNFFSGTAITVPDDLDDENEQVPTLTSDTLLTYLNACDSSVDQTLTLCFGLDVDDDDEIQEDEPRGWAQVEVDTDPPPQPDTPDATPLDGRCRISAEAIDGVDDITQWKGWMRPRTEDTTPPCAEWKEDEVTDFDQVGAEGSGPTTFTLSGQNGTTYDICVAAIDDADNQGTCSDLVECTPQVECGFIECYPDGLLAGGCLATGGTPLPVLVVLAYLRRRARVARESR